MLAPRDASKTGACIYSGQQCAKAEMQTSSRKAVGLRDFVQETSAVTPERMRQAGTLGDLALRT